MADTSIEWTDKTWNPTTGCTRVSPGCKNCYAFALHDQRHAAYKAGRTGLPVQYAKPFREVQLFEDRLYTPAAWRKPARIFVDSMSDLFHKDVPDAFIRRVFGVMSLCGQHMFQILTKRADRMAAWFADPANTLDACQAEETVHRPDPDPMTTPTGRDRLRDSRAINGTYGPRVGEGNYWPLPNVWLGVSVENQAAADERIPHLMRTPAAVRFLSCEPLLGPVDLTPMYVERECPNWAPDGSPPVMCPETGARECCRKCDYTGSVSEAAIDWVIVGGESGPGARPCDAAWVRALVGQCKAAGVPVFVKQLGENVVTRSDEVSEWADECGIALDDIDTSAVRIQGDPVRVHLRDRKGGDPAEWPVGLRVRQFPTPRAA